MHLFLQSVLVAPELAPLTLFSNFMPLAVARFCQRPGGVVVKVQYYRKLCPQPGGEPGGPAGRWAERQPGASHQSSGQGSEWVGRAQGSGSGRAPPIFTLPLLALRQSVGCSEFWLFSGDNSIWPFGGRAGGGEVEEAGHLPFSHNLPAWLPLWANQQPFSIWAIPGWRQRVGWPRSYIELPKPLCILPTCSLALWVPAASCPCSQLAMLSCPVMTGGDELAKAIFGDGKRAAVTWPC